MFQLGQNKRINDTLSRWSTGGYGSQIACLNANGTFVFWMRLNYFSKHFLSEFSHNFYLLREGITQLH